MSNEPLALQKVNELRSVVSDQSDMAEMVDTLATLLVLRQDMTNPMLGAKVTFWEKPEGEWVDIDYETYREHHENADVLPDDPEEIYSESERTGRMSRDDEEGLIREGEPWWLRWRRIDGDRNSTIPDGTHEHEFTQYKQWSGQEELDGSDVPDEILEADGVGEKQSVAEERAGEEWTIYRSGTGDERSTTYKADRLVHCSEFVGRRAIVIEASIAEQPNDTEFWDPNRQEYTTPEDYPMGTVNVTLPEDPENVLGEDYVHEMRIETSVVPADGDPGSHSYTPGWD